jgi:hypothetical protein
MGAKATREDQQGTPGLVQRASQHITAHQPQSRTPASIKPHVRCTTVSVLVSLARLQHCWATLLCALLCGKLEVISPPLAPCPTTSSSRIRHHSSARAAVVALCLPAHVYSYPQRIILYHPPSVLASDTRPFVQAEVPLVVETTHIKEQLQQSTPLSQRVRLALLFATPFLIGLNGWELRTGPAEWN